MADKKQLVSNVNLVDEDGVSKWYGPDYPQNGDPPEGAVTNPAAFEVETVDMTPRELLEADADPTRAGVRPADGGDETGGEPGSGPSGGEVGGGRRGGAR